MFNIARDTIKSVANGGYVPATYGPDRPIMRDSLVAVLRGIEPSEADRIEAAFTGGRVANRVRAYDRGVAYLREAYNTLIA